MNTHLLFLLALVGPFCAIIYASPTEHPTGAAAVITDSVVQTTFAATEAQKEDVFTGVPPTDPATAHEVVFTEAVTTEAAQPVMPATTEEIVVETVAPTHAATAAPEPLVTEAPVVETHASTETPKDEPVTEAATISTDNQVVVEEGIDDGLSSGQVVGIVIGALLAVIVLIAVVIAVVRRMGKYSSAKNKKPAKSTGVITSPLKKKSAKQQQQQQKRSRFWKV